ncbi:TPA: hypothetical protein H1V50_003857 [Salmonella enterica]|nr:hypothetical protein [Salmonella enterica]
MNNKITLLVALMLSGCNSVDYKSQDTSLTNIANTQQCGIQSQKKIPYSTCVKYEDAHQEAKFFFQKHPEYINEKKESRLFAEFNMLLQHKKYQNLTMLQLLEMAHQNIQ